MSVTAAKKRAGTTADGERPKRSRKAAPKTEGILTRTAKAPPKAKAEAKTPKEKPAPKPKGPKYPGPVVRLLFPNAVYVEHKDRVKEEIKDEGLGFQFLGRGQGRYFDDKVSIFAKWGEEAADFTLRGDAKVVEKLAASWRALGAHDYTEEAKAEEEAAEVRAWKLEKPVQRAGEPEFFFKKRLAEWEAQRPAGA